MTMSIRQIYLRSLPGLYIVHGSIWNCQVCPRRTRHLLFLFKNLMKLRTNNSYCTPIYTDGSKDNERVGCGTIIHNSSCKQRLPSNASIFTAEVTAIDLALDAITESDDDHFIIFSDLFSVLLSLHNMKLDNALILKLFEKLHHLSCAHKTIYLCWIPSHIGIRGNEAADMGAKESLNLDITDRQVPYTDL